ncbi:MAG: hypothetical protein WC443_13095 [Desulfobaccales bacterium]
MRFAYEVVWFADDADKLKFTFQGGGWREDQSLPDFLNFMGGEGWELIADSPESWGITWTQDFPNSKPEAAGLHRNLSRLIFRKRLE